MARQAVVVALLLLSVGAALVAGATVDDDQETSGLSARPLSSIDTSDVITIVFMSLGLALAAAGGVGGGPIIVPLLVLAMGFNIKEATPISNVVIIGGAIANAIFNFQKRHPHVDRPLIDPDISLAMIPPMIGGAVIGAFLSKLLPGYIISILFVCVLVIAGSRSMKKAIKLHHKEAAKRTAIEVPYQEATTPTTGEKTLPETVPSTQVPTATPLDVEAGPATDADRLAQLLESERHFSWTKHGIIVVCFLGVVAASIGGSKSSCGGTLYWLLLWGELPWVLAFSVGFAVYMTKHRLLKRALQFPFAEGDVDWTAKAVVRFPLACAGAGVVAGLFGIGGGIITGPLMIEMGVVPEVASGTTALLVLYAAAAATAKFAVFKMIAWDWALLLSGVAFVVTLISQACIVSYVRRTGRQSIIVFCIASSICIGACLMMYQSVKVTVNEAGDPFSIDICIIKA